MRHASGLMTYWCVVLHSCDMSSSLKWGLFMDRAQHISLGGDTYRRNRLLFFHLLINSRDGGCSSSRFVLHTIHIVGSGQWIRSSSTVSILFFSSSF